MSSPDDTGPSGYYFFLPAPPVFFAGADFLPVTPIAEAAPGGTYTFALSPLPTGRLTAFAGTEPRFTPPSGTGLLTGFFGGGLDRASHRMRRFLRHNYSSLLMSASMTSYK